MAYLRSNVLPDWCGYLLSLREVLEDIIFLLDEDDRTGVSPDLSYLEASDRLNQYLDQVKQELGI